MLDMLSLGKLQFLNMEKLLKRWIIFCVPLNFGRPIQRIGNNHALPQQQKLIILLTFDFIVGFGIPR